MKEKLVKYVWDWNEFEACMKYVIVTVVLSPLSLSHALLFVSLDVTLLRLDRLDESTIY